MTRLIKPPAAALGSEIAIVAPASSANPERTERGLASLSALGFVPTLGANALLREPLYFAGTPAQRLADLHAAFSDPATSAVMALRGGYGSNYLLEGLDLAIIAAHPKPFFGYSDLTGIQLHLLDELGLPAFHGPMLAADFYLEDGVHLESFRAALAGEPYTVGPAEGLRALKPAAAQEKVQGTLYGGCLSILVSLLGTPWEPATENKLLFLEDTGVKPYQVDRMLWQLRAAGKLAGVCGIIFGEMLDCVSAGAAPGLLDRAILNTLDGLDIPIAIGLRSGHVSRQNVTLTFGVEAELALADEPTLKFLEPAVTK
ncbi:MAG: LD-carboxypeptidase [Terracidiphilus sp.]|nr:LD-carboxypeptidase [Terracidiphilus sp.]MDR3799418.1 LD-carboxypeptidase [Terracidiphilus sp.]